MYKEVVSPILDHFDSERGHVFAREALHLAEGNPATLKLVEMFADQHVRLVDSRLNIRAGEVSFESPVMVGAGWDKKGRAVRALHRLGFAGVEVGSVLAYGQPGNEKPRQFMVGPGVALNRLGFNAPSVDVVKKNLKRYEGEGIVIGISVGKNKEIDKDAPKMHAIVVRELYDEASYFTLNVSSPNTPGIRALQEKAPLTDNVQAINAQMDSLGKRKDLYIKLAPDLSYPAVNDALVVGIDNGVTGFIIANATINDEIKDRYGVRGQAGGISGDDPDFRRMSTDMVAHIYRETKGKLVLIGVGGINSTETALERIRVGAKVVQLVTGIRGEGTTLPGKINRGILAYMDRVGVKNIEDLVGVGNTV